MSTARSADVEVRDPRGYRLERGELLLSILVALCALGAAAAYPTWRGHVYLACPLWQIAGIPCPTCGGTRAMAALAAGRIGEAIAWNPLVAAIGFGLLAWVPLGTLMVAGLLRSPRIPTKISPAVRWLLPLLVGMNWLYLSVWFRG